MVCVILLAHFVADFVLQSDRMAKLKSGSFAWLSWHVSVYTAALWLASIPLDQPWWWAPLNGAAHFATDAVTSRASSALWKRGEVHWFFVVIGFDQLAHTVILIMTAAWSVPL